MFIKYLLSAYYVPDTVMNEYWGSCSQKADWTLQSRNIQSIYTFWQIFMKREPTLVWEGVSLRLSYEGWEEDRGTVICKSVVCIEGTKKRLVEEEDGE